ncbi:MAG: hypothetical protein ABIH46_13685, partial [Chloroflexota bacterium]
AAEEAVHINRELAAERPDAFRPYLAGSLNTVARCLSGLGRREEALELTQQAVKMLKPQSLALPGAFAQWMGTMAANYLRRCQDLQRVPDRSLLGPILRALQELEKGGQE